MSHGNKNRVDVYQIITDRLIEIMEQGVVPWKKTWNCGGETGPLNLVSKRHYQGINCFLLSCHSFETPYWLTYNQAISLGGNVKKGEKGTPVIFWKMYNKENPESERVTTVPVLRYYTVFNTEQCEGITTSTPENSTWTEHDPIEAAEAVILAMPNRPSVEIGGSRACYSPTLDLVRVPELFRYEQAEEYYSTFFHELAHATGHESRLNREGITGNHFFGDSVYSREELVAEMTAAFLCGQTGIATATLRNSAAYIQSWIRTLKGDKKLAIIAAAQAQKAADYILNKKPHENEDNS